MTLEYQDNGLDGFDTVEFAKWVSTFRRNMLLKMKTTGFSERLVSICQIHSVTTQTKVILTLTAM
jgi:hypothetical protein